MDAHAVDTIPPIIAAFAPSKSSRAPIDFGVAASRVTGAPLIVVHVHRGGPLVSWFGGDVDDSVGDDARYVDNLRKDFEREKVPAQIEAVRDRTIAGGLQKAIEEHKPQLVVLGSSTRGSIGTVLLGGSAERLIHEATCPVAIVPHRYQRPEQGVQMVGAAFTNTPEGHEALEAAAMMARRARRQACARSPCSRASSTRRPG